MRYGRALERYKIGHIISFFVEIKTVQNVYYFFTGRKERISFFLLGPKMQGIGRYIFL